MGLARLESEVVAFIQGVHFSYTKTDSMACNGDTCEHYAVAYLLPKDRIRGRSYLYCWKHLLMANKQIHAREKARKIWL